MSEAYTLQPDGALLGVSRVEAGGRSTTARLVYARSAGGRDALLAESRKRNSSMAAVIKRQESEFGGK